ncbi:uncharacterized protein [Lolium perenne]|uniref:uncharacterized protein isoform X2 n=1 Tax=Lolium perenne TaxID=4522 RepID=UPI003A98DDCB
MGDSSSSASYIRMVHHLIEKCICFNLNKEECMDALEKHARVNPVVTSTGAGEGEQGVLRDVQEGPRGAENRGGDDAADPEDALRRGCRQELRRRRGLA